MEIFKQLTRIFDAGDDDERIVREAAEGQDVDFERLGEAYWRLYRATYRLPKIWKAMSPAQKEGVYRERRRIRSHFYRFSRAAQDWVAEMEPPRPEDWVPPRRNVEGWD
ncbi:MAG: hypothetical protein KDA73_04305 [Rhodobacteraceae bacterium]|nr:hypothetical protein [Paracoccaceae bacterium]